MKQPEKVQFEGVSGVCHAYNKYRTNISRLQLILLIYHMYKYHVLPGSVILSLERLSV